MFEIKARESLCCSSASFQYTTQWMSLLKVKFFYISSRVPVFCFFASTYYLLSQMSRHVQGFKITNNQPHSSGWWDFDWSTREGRLWLLLYLCKWLSSSSLWLPSLQFPSFRILSRSGSTQYLVDTTKYVFEPGRPGEKGMSLWPLVLNALLMASVTSSCKLSFCVYIRLPK